MLQNHMDLVKRQIQYYESLIARYPPDHPRYRAHQVELYRRIIGQFRDLMKLLRSLPRTTRAATEDDQPSFFGAGLDFVKPPEFYPTHTSPAAPLTTPVTKTSIPAKDDLSDLPPDLLAELSDAAKGETDPLIRIINERGGTANLDEILIDLYRKFGEIGKRPIISNRLYRLSKRGLCAASAGKKGVYTTRSSEQQGNPTNPDDQDDEGPGAQTSEPSPENLEKRTKSTPVAASLTASTELRRKLLSEAATPVDPLSTAAAKGVSIFRRA